MVVTALPQPAPTDPDIHLPIPQVPTEDIPNTDGREENCDGEGSSPMSSAKRETVRVVIAVNDAPLHGIIFCPGRLRTRRDRRRCLQCRASRHAVRRSHRGTFDRCIPDMAVGLASCSLAKTGPDTVFLPCAFRHRCAPRRTARWCESTASRPRLGHSSPSRGTSCARRARSGRPATASPAPSFARCRGC